MFCGDRTCWLVGVEQAFRPAAKLLKKSALAAEVLDPFGNMVLLS